MQKQNSILSSHDAGVLRFIAEEAGRRILPFFRNENNARSKADHSPVTDADLAAHEYILDALAREFPEIPVVSEEDTAQEAGATTPQSGAAVGRTLYFLVDPLDGTRAFVAGEDEFTVNIGLIEQGRPGFGVLFAPALGVMYAGGVGHAAMRYDTSGEVAIAVRKSPSDGLTVTRSKSHASAKTQAFLNTIPVKEIIHASSAIKFGWVAEGRADLYVRLGRTMEWDTAAGHAIVNAAGGRVWVEGGEELTYGKPNFENPGFFAGTTHTP